MKEIKFRAWDIDLSEWYPHDFYVNNGGVIVFYNGEFLQAEIPERFIVCQYTGLKDLNGVEIYEGDIFTVDQYPFMNDGDHNYSGVVIYEDGPDYLAWYYDIYAVSDRVAGRACGSAMSDLFNLEIKVIGNIHENPELLKVAE